jgi:hypothetical protein
MQVNRENFPNFNKYSRRIRFSCKIDARFSINDVRKQQIIRRQNVKYSK